MLMIYHFFLFILLFNRQIDRQIQNNKVKKKREKAIFFYLEYDEINVESTSNCVLHDVFLIFFFIEEDSNGIFQFYSVNGSD